MNDTSSRSHAALIATIIMREGGGDNENDSDGDRGRDGGEGGGGKDKDKGSVSNSISTYSESSLVIVDLAGSER